MNTNRPNLAEAYQTFKNLMNADRTYDHRVIKATASVELAKHGLTTQQFLDELRSRVCNKWLDVNTNVSFLD
jgi:hypothetical protein